MPTKKYTKTRFDRVKVAAIVAVLKENNLKVTRLLVRAGTEWPTNVAGRFQITEMRPGETSTWFGIPVEGVDMIDEYAFVIKVEREEQP